MWFSPRCLTRPNALSGGKKDVSLESSQQNLQTKVALQVSIKIRLFMGS